MKNHYHPNFIDSCIKSFLDKLYTHKVMVQNVPEKNVFVKLPSLGSTSFKNRKKLQKTTGVCFVYERSFTSYVVRVPLQSLNLQISRLYRAWIVDSVDTVDSL